MAVTTMKHLSRLLALCLTGLLAACATGGSTSAPPKPNTESQAVNTYLIGVDDQLQITVWHNPDLSVSVPVRPDGKITVPLIGDVVAGGRTPEQVSTDISGKLQSFVRDPQVAVILTALRSHEYLSRVRVTGAVRTPISVPYRQGMTVLDAVLAAGGTTEFAAPDRTELYRTTDAGATTAYAVRLEKILQQGDLANNYPVQPGDVITVPQRAF
jgi:polysaccharide export outer membrane protein